MKSLILLNSHLNKLLLKLTKSQLMRSYRNPFLAAA